MFQTPDWANDVPDAKFNFVDSRKGKVLGKKGKTKTEQNKNMNQIVEVTNHKKKNNINLGQKKKGIKVKERRGLVVSTKDSTSIFKKKNDLLNSKNNTKHKSILHKSKVKLDNSTTSDYGPKKAKKIKHEERMNASFKTITKSNDSTKSVDNGPRKANKRKHEADVTLKTALKNKKNNLENIYNTDNPDEGMIQAKKRKLEKKFKKQNKEETLFFESPKAKKIKNINSSINPSEQSKGFFKKQQLKQLLESNRNKIKTNGNKLRERMLEKLKAAQFRYLNEKLYTSTGSDAQELFSSDPNAFHTYHQGYRQQLKKWPVNPIDVIVKRIQKIPKTMLIADLGCGEAALSKRIPHTVRSFDLVATAPGVEVCNMAHTPLLTGSMDVAVYCLALMGTELTQYLVEANRILKTGGLLLIAEVESRFDDINKFTEDIQRLGFKLIKLDKTNNVFFFMEFKKIQEPPAKQGKRPLLYLKPCLYKRR